MIKILALILMLIDHIGLALFPANTILRAIGRLSMPLFAYSIAIGFEHCRNKGNLTKYAFNLYIFALISQLPFSIFVKGNILNIGVTWLIAFFMLYIYTNNKLGNKKYIIMPIFFILIIYLNSFIINDYRAYGIVIPLLMYIVYVEKKIHPAIGMIIMLIISGIAIHQYNWNNSQYLSALSFIIIEICRKMKKDIRIPKQISYIFYPAHMIVLSIIRYFL